MARFALTISLPSALSLRRLQKFTLKRGDFRHEENIFLATQFAEWFGALTGTAIGGLEESFCKSLDDGVVLCRVMQHLEGSELRKIHDPVTNPFQGRENIVMFQDACRRLGLPFVFKASHARARQLSRVPRPPPKPYNTYQPVFVNRCPWIDGSSGLPRSRAFAFLFQHL